MICMKTGRPPQKPKTDFGKHLAAIRKEKNVSQNELAQAMGVTQCAIAHWERRSISLTPEQVIKLAHALDVSLEQLFGKNDLRRRKGYSGKMHLLFESASKLPRRQQEKIVEFVEPYIERQQAIHS